MGARLSYGGYINAYKTDQFPVYPTVFKTKSIINQEHQTRTNPIIAAYIIFLPVPIKFGLPAEISIKIPPIVRAITARGVAIILTIKS